MSGEMPRPKPHDKVGGRWEVGGWRRGRLLGAFTRASAAPVRAPSRRPYHADRAHCFVRRRKGLSSSWVHSSPLGLLVTPRRRICSRTRPFSLARLRPLRRIADHLGLLGQLLLPWRGPPGVVRELREDHHVLRRLREHFRDWVLTFERC